VLCRTYIPSVHIHIINIYIGSYMCYVEHIYHERSVLDEGEVIAVVPPLEYNFFFSKPEE
jgi:hypothetical protein